MRRAISACLLAIAWLGVLSGAAMARTPQVKLPDWVKDVAARPQKSYEPRTNAVVLLDERKIVVNRSGEYIESVRRVVRILRTEGKNEARFGITVESSDALLSAQAWCSSPDEHNYEVKQKEFVQVGNWIGGDMYSDLVHYTTEVPGSNPGA